MGNTYRRVLVISGIIFYLFSVAYAYSGGTGEPDSPYQIGTVLDWQQLMGTETDWDKHFILVNDVNLQGVAATPVGNRRNRFTGVFNGNGHVIYNANINMPSNDYIGLFGVFGPNSRISNLGVEDVNVTGGNKCIGGLVGYSSSNITACYATGTVAGEWAIGGLVGANQGIITNCYAAGEVNGIEYVGGLVGYNREDITNCYATGAVTGNQDVGGLVGGNRDGTITASFWDIETSGQTTSAGGEGLTTAEMQDINTFLNAGWDFVGEIVNGTEDIWTICQGVSYPRLWWEPVEPICLVIELIDDVDAMGFNKGTANSLLAKLNAALQKLEDNNENNDTAAVNLLEAFINAVEAQSGKKISHADADFLIATAHQIIELLRK